MYLSMYLSIFLSIYLSINLFIYLSIYHLSIFLSIYLPLSHKSVPNRVLHEAIVPAPVQLKYGSLFPPLVRSRLFIFSPCQEDILFTFEVPLTPTTTTYCLGSTITLASSLYSSFPLILTLF